MRDAQLGLMDAASYFAFAPGEINFEILSLEPPCQPSTTLSTRTDNVVKMTMARSHEVVNFLIRRESQLEQYVTQT